MGTYITFNVGPSERLRRERAKVLRTFFELGGGMIDSSPMYGTSEEVVGDCLRRVGGAERMYSATKVWTRNDREGARQISESQKLWGVDRFDLLQVHNLVNWRSHLDLLRRRKEKGEVGAIGVTTSHGRRHRELEAVLRDEPLDFVQLTYNIVDRGTEERLIPLAREKRVAVIANRPYRGGWLMDRYQSKRLPDWAREAGISNWADFFLKYIITLPGVTCAIPATSKVVHMRENMGAMRGAMPDETDRRRMAEYFARL
jgi:diketogulonate reductase-like aldo/keto reductase